MEYYIHTIDPEREENGNWKLMSLEDIYFFIKDNLDKKMQITIEEVDPKTDKTTYAWVVRRGDIIPRFFYDNSGIL